MNADVKVPADEVVDLLNHVVDVCIVRHSNGDETFQECRVCGEWEGHTDLCPMPAIERWLMTPETEADAPCEHAWRLNKHGRICVLCMTIEEGKGPKEP